jgi:DNA polymerase-1
LLSTYVRGIKERIINGRIHASWLLHGTVSGRASSRNPNLHNIPRTSPIKNAFVASEGNVFIHIDYNQVEFRVMAVMSEDPWLQEQFRLGRKFHDEVATELYGPNFTKDQKIRAKAINFGIPYGRGAASIAAEHHMSLQEAQQLLNQWFARMPKMRTWIDGVHHQVFKNGGILTTPYGRKRRFLLVTDFNKKDIMHESVAFLPQSTASDVTLGALGSLWKPLQNYDAYIVNWIHDALIIECPKEHVNEVIALSKEVMTKQPEIMFNFPFPVDAEVGDRWGNLVSED